MTYQASSKSSWSIFVGAITVFCLPLLLGYLLVKQSRQADESYQWVEHTYAVVEQLESLTHLAREAESAQRGFLLTQDERFTHAYNSILLRRQGILDGLARLVSDNPGQMRRLEKVSRTLEERMNLLEKNSRDFHTLDPETTKARLTAGADKSAELQQRIQEMISIENDLLGKRRGQLLSDKLVFQRLAILASAVGLMLMVGVGYLMHREHKSRNLYEARLADARDAALDAVKTTSAFVASVSHEIRTPMNGVLGTADLLLRDSNISPKQRDGLETIRTSGRSLLAIINDILDLSKLQAGEMVFVKERFSPERLVEEVITLFAAQAGKKNLELAAHLAPDLPPFLMGDHQRLRQVLVNLISNAVKFTEQGGVTVHLVRRRESESDNRVCLRFDVTDTGPGIAKEVQGRLFLPFAQVDLKLAQRHGGTGLGLAVSRELVQRMNGAMGVESSPGRGASFWFTALFEPGQDASASKALDTRQLIVVENRPMTAEAVRVHAQAWGLQPIMFTQESEVPELAPTQGERLASAIVIGSTEAKDWLESARRLRARDWLKQVPIFVMTDKEDIHSAEMSEAGIRSVLHYPFRPSELYDHLAGVSPPSMTPEVAARLDLPPSRVIVADDNPVNQRVIANQLEYLGMTVIICSDGSEAVARVQEGAGELVLMDCKMPVMDGFEATQAIRQWECSTARKPIPIIAVTAHVMTGDAEQCLQVGMNAYLAKPLELNRLQHALQQWLPHADGRHRGSSVLQADGTVTIATAAPVNEEQLRACLTGEEELDLDLVQMAVNLLNEMLASMSTALQEGADAAWRHAAHRARGSCGTMGFAQVAELLQIAEFEATSQSARSLILDELQHAVPPLVARLVELKLLSPVSNITP